MPKAKEDYTLRKLRSEHKNAAKRLEGWEDAVQIAMGEVEDNSKKEIPKFLLESVTHYRKEVSSIREKILREEKKLSQLVR